MFSWNLIFPTAIEILLWRISAPVVLSTAAAFCLWELAWGVVRAVYLLYLNKISIRPKAIYYVYAYKINKIPRANGLHIHNIKFDTGVVTFGHMLLMVPLAVL